MIDYHIKLIKEQKYCDMHAYLLPLLSNGPGQQSTVKTLVKQPLLGNGRINTQQTTANTTMKAFSLGSGITVCYPINPVVNPIPVL
jgi:hypothetical protein